MPVQRVCGFEAGLNMSLSCTNEVGIEYFWYVSGSFRFFYFISLHFYFVNSLCFAFLSVFHSVPFRFIPFHWLLRLLCADYPSPDLHPFDNARSPPLLQTRDGSCRTWGFSTTSPCSMLLWTAGGMNDEADALPVCFCFTFCFVLFLFHFCFRSIPFHRFWYVFFFLIFTYSNMLR